MARWSQVSVDFADATGRRTDLMRPGARNQPAPRDAEFKLLAGCDAWASPDWPHGCGSEGCRNSLAVASAALDAAHQQATTLPTEAIGSALVARFDADITAIDRELGEFDAQITSQFPQHDAAEILLSQMRSRPATVLSVDTSASHRRLGRRAAGMKLPGHIG